MIEFCKFNFKLLLKKSARLEKGERASFFLIFLTLSTVINEKYFRFLVRNPSEDYD